ncbi:hypothetical protein [uncultured Paludibaculum sp.]|uniref:hypothetical protein n=1 Tax=uncultured Paludibaculum sp. TaxID=1765020 RepID=UPI002AAAE4E5|nr:hypothetical protein [uncultured Paludibaculum sp.]
MSKTLSRTATPLAPKAARTPATLSMNSVTMAGLSMFTIATVDVPEAATVQTSSRGEVAFELHGLAFLPDKEGDEVHYSASYSEVVLGTELPSRMLGSGVEAKGTTGCGRSGGVDPMSRLLSTHDFRRKRVVDLAWLPL